jgi:RimJ/RimL family protein N-acetyltransferase
VPELTSPVVPAGTLRTQAQPSLTVDELLLRPWLTTDAASVVEAYSDPAIQRWHTRSMTEAEAASWVASRSELWVDETGAEWAVVDRGAVIGRVGFRGLNLSEGLAEAAYWVVPSARGRSIAPRALQAATSWVFATVGLHRIELLHAVDNEPSCRVAAKAGYALEGTKRSHGLFADGWHDMHLHARVRDDLAGPP